MIRTEEIKHLVCDWCGSETYVRSYAFLQKEFDGHRNDIHQCTIELCPSCQVKAAELLLEYGKGNQVEPKS